MATTLQLTDSKPLLLKSSLLRSSHRRPNHHHRFRLIPRASSSSSSGKTRRHFISDTASVAALVPLSVASLQLQESPARSEEPPPLSEWERVYLPIDPGVVLLDIAFVPDDPSHGFLLGTRQTILETKDGGNTWVPRSIPSAEDEDFNYRFNSISFMGKDGWIVGKPAILLYTSDAGESWERIPLSAQLPGDMVYIKATGEKSAEMVTDEGAIYVTANRGYNWKAAVQETVSATLNRTVSSGISGASYYTGTFNNVNRSPDGRYVAVSSRGNFYLTWEPGQPYWQPHNRAVARRIQNMGWRADGGLWLLVRGGGLYLSKGTGISEDFEEIPVQSRGFGILDVGYRSKDEAWAAGGSGILLRTTNGGKSWARDKAADSIVANLYSVKCTVWTEGRLGIAKGPPALTENSPVISEPVLVSTHSNGINAELEKGNSSSLGANTLPISQVAENHGISGPDTSNDPEKFREEQAAIKAQAAFRGFLARRAFCALKGIIRLQALVRGHLVRRQAVVTLHSMLGIIKLQALVRSQKVRVSGLGLEVETKFSQGKAEVPKYSDSKKGKLYSNAFVCKLLSSSLVVMPLQIRYDQGEPNSVFSWMERWTFSRFWKPPAQPKKISDSKSQAKRGGYAMETESGRPKRSVRRSSLANFDNGPSNIISEPEKPKRTQRKVTTSTDSVQDHPQSELEKVKRNLRKVSSSYAEISEKSETGTDTQSRSAKKVSDFQSDTQEQAIDDSSGKMKKDIALTPEPQLDLEIASKSMPIEEPVESSLTDNLPAPEPNTSPSIAKEENVTVVNGELSVKEDQTCNDNHKTSKRRSSFSAKPEYAENGIQNSPNLPSYMQATESAKAKLRGQNSPKFDSDSAEKNGITRRHSLPSSTNGKVTSHSPRTQTILQASTKGGIRSDRSLLSLRDGNEKLIQVEWRR